MYGIELGVVVVSTLGCALGSGSIGMSSTGVLVFWRVMMVCFLSLSAGYLIGLLTAMIIGSGNRGRLPPFECHHIRVRPPPNKTVRKHLTSPDSHQPAGVAQ